jgi:hypothetical protein
VQQARQPASVAELAMQREGLLLPGQGSAQPPEDAVADADVVERGRLAFAVARGPP